MMSDFALMVAANTPFCYGLVTLLSVLVGSLLNVFIYRLPLMLQHDFLSDCRSALDISAAPDKKINLFFPRSFCPHCKHTIGSLYNIPIISYLLLRGRCSYCQASVSSRYPLVEALSGILALFACWQIGFNLTLVFALLYIWILLILIFIDIDHQLLPDCLTLSLLWLGLLANTQSLFIPLETAVLSAIGAWLSLWLFIWGYYLISGKIGMGNGDFKLFAAFGAWFGWTQIPIILLIACVTGALVGIIYLKSQHKTQDTPIPFGPFLCLAGFMSLFWGHSFMAWYIGLLQ